MTMTRKAINELLQLRGSQVEIFGQPVTLPNTVDDLEIDTINILKDMEEYELDWYDFTYYTEDEDGNEIEVDIFEGCETAEDILDVPIHHRGHGHVLLAVPYFLPVSKNTARLYIYPFHQVAETQARMPLYR